MESASSVPQRIRRLVIRFVVFAFILSVVLRFMVIAVKFMVLLMPCHRATLTTSVFHRLPPPGLQEQEVEIVEFSDLECPACKGKWPMVKGAMESSGAAIRHGMVSFPLTSIHPWAFRASSATWCVGAQSADQVIGFKELFYELQRDMEVGLVTPTSTDFVAGNGLDEEAFRACYLRGSSLDAVHAQLALGHRVGVNATPTYFVNGWMIQMPQDEWFADLISRLAKGQEP